MNALAATYRLLSRGSLNWIARTSGIAGFREMERTALELAVAAFELEQAHVEALEEENERRRDAGLPTVRGVGKRFQVLAVPFRMVKPEIVDGRYTQAEKVATTPGSMWGFDSAQAASDHAYTLGTKLGNHDITIYVDGREVSRAALKGMARKEYNARLAQA